MIRASRLRDLPVVDLESAVTERPFRALDMFRTEQSLARLLAYWIQFGLGADDNVGIKRLTVATYFG